MANRARWPATCPTRGTRKSLADLKPATLVVMHGSSYRGQAEGQLTELAGVIRKTFDAG
jgi:hypothetical protein